MATLEFFGKEHGRLINAWEDNIKWIWNCEDGRWIELAQDRVQWRALVLEALNLMVLPPES
jgi:hypothetical protein